MQVEEIQYPDLCQIAHHFHKQRGCLWLDSAKTTTTMGRYSYLAIDPFEIIRAKHSQIQLNQRRVQTNKPLDFLQEMLAQYPMPYYDEFPVFQGGAAGYFSYDLRHSLEKLPYQEKDDNQFPDMMLGLYDLLITVNHQQRRAWLISTGFPETQPSKQTTRAQQRLAWLKNELQQLGDMPTLSTVGCQEKDITSNFTQSGYEAAVQKTIDYILAGDIFEANISQRFQAPLPNGLHPFELYRRLRHLNPAPFAAYFNAGDHYIASASPERFIQVIQDQVETRPIKGTRPRGATFAEDQTLAMELEQSEKDWAENVMIVDLMRNDLSRVCLDNSVKVPQLCALESFATVHHLVSVVKAVLQPGKTPVDVLTATFPGGSITGAPKIRTMEIIGEIEKINRGPYCGSLGFIGFNGNMDTSITIRTFAIKNGLANFQAGGAIVLDSDPTEEYFETLDKACALKKALLGKNYDCCH